jgi:hypothetical protein
MSSITANAAVQQLLSQITEVTEIRDGSGKVLGVFTPLTANESEMYDRARTLFDPARTERIFAEEHGKGRPLAEIWKDLEAQEHEA